ncbi:MAG: exodeoxyribonuclease I, partial [Burkholderiaceae bacterium]|nr:exodeoxyribonuclease I [Burkholderiaceae bacterium]
SDVRATVALARLIKDKQPKLWDFCLKLRKKDAVIEEMANAQKAGQPFLHVSGMYPPDRGCIALVWPLSPHPTNKNEVIVWDLAEDPGVLRALNADTIRQRMFSRTDALPEGVTRLPIKTIHLNKSPVVIANLKTLSPEMAARWGIDVVQARKHADVAAHQTALLAGLWPEVFERPAPEATPDVDEDLYGGFVGNDDRRLLQRLRTLDPKVLAGQRPVFADGRLGELLFRYRARNFPDTLSDAEQQQWHEHRVHRLHDGAGGGLTLQAFFERIDQLSSQFEDPTDERAQEILGALVDHATEIAPELP